MSSKDYSRPFTSLIAFVLFIILLILHIIAISSNPWVSIDPQSNNVSLTENQLPANSADNSTTKENVNIFNFPKALDDLGTNSSSIDMIKTASKLSVYTQGFSLAWFFIACCGLFLMCFTWNFYDCVRCLIFTVFFIIIGTVLVSIATCATLVTVRPYHDYPAINVEWCVWVEIAVILLGLLSSIFLACSVVTAQKKTPETKQNELLVERGDYEG
ncbi:hypothetical protein SNEBB_010157 [Seison nebaliae]|nr:hypothetical protein SNEBB_010157 [Seison nebaliae]